MTDIYSSLGSIYTRNSAESPLEKIWTPHSLNIKMSPSREEHIIQACQFYDPA